MISGIIKVEVSVISQAEGLVVEMSRENRKILLDYDSENSMDCLTLEWLYLFFCNNGLSKHQTWGF